MESGLTKKQAAEIRGAFKVFDKDGNGTISTDELGLMIRSMGHAVTDDGVQKIMEHLDDDRTGAICFGEFVKFMSGICKGSSSREDVLRGAFALYDKDGNGQINVSELREVLHSSGNDVTEEEAAEMIREVDEDEDGTLDYEEFLQMLRSKS